MKAKELVGKQAIRTAPVNRGNGVKDYSYSNEPLVILKVTSSHIVYTHKEGYFKDKVSILDSRWNDGNWTDYDELINLGCNPKENDTPKVVELHPEVSVGKSL